MNRIIEFSLKNRMLVLILFAVFIGISVRAVVVGVGVDIETFVIVRIGVSVSVDVDGCIDACVACAGSCYVGWSLWPIAVSTQGDVIADAYRGRIIKSIQKKRVLARCGWL